MHVPTKDLQELWEEAMQQQQEQVKAMLDAGEHHPDYKFKCQGCSSKTEEKLGNRKIEPSWCDSCGGVMKFERIDK